MRKLNSGLGSSKLTVLVTGAAGFIGMHTCLALVRAGHKVVGMDHLPADGDVSLRTARLKQLGIHWPEGAGEGHTETTEGVLTFTRMDICDRDGLSALFAVHDFDAVCHLAAKGGVRRSLTEPFAYAETNITGFLNVLECCRHHATAQLVYASSSSVYGDAQDAPFLTTDPTDSPVSLYAATKKSNELMAHAYAHLFGFRATGLRFFTVYGPWGRPDMAMFLFTDAILRGRPVRVFNHGNLARDFTYVDDVVQGIMRVLDAPPSAASEMHRVYNVGNNDPVSVLELIGIIEQCSGRKAQIELLPMQPGDVHTTCADVSALVRDHGYAPTTDIRTGVRQYVAWFSTYYRV